MAGTSLEKKMLQLIDKQEISEAIGRWARGIDRDDPQLCLSAFHPDGLDCHGPFNKPQSEFVQQVLPELRKRQVQQTFLMNQAIDLDGDTAHAETYFIIVRKYPNDPYVEQTAGRFLDRLERRSGEWKIALRVVFSEWYQRADGAGLTEQLSKYNKGTRDRTDGSYERPLQPRAVVASKFEVPWQYPTQSAGSPSKAADSAK
jgi:hypothetical protein